MPPTAAAAPPAFSSTATATGAASVAALSNQPCPAFAAASSSADITTDGSRTACAGRGTQIARLTTGASANTDHRGAPTAISTATAPIDTTKTAYAQNKTRPGRYRSASAPRRVASSMPGTSCTSAIALAAVAPPPLP